MNPEYLNTLNPMQRQAVELGSVNSLILAGAGSGKTKVLTHRIANLIAHGTSPSRILAVTFTNKAAREMRTRLWGLLERQRTIDAPARVLAEHPATDDPPRSFMPYMGTFHGICVRLLRIEHVAAGLDRNFTIYDSEDQLTLIRRIFRDLKLTGNKSFTPKYAHSLISDWKNSGASPSAAAAEAIYPNQKHAAAVTVKNLAFAYGRKQPDILFGMDYTAEQGRINAIVGANGCGKTTFLKCLAGILRPYGGKIKKNGKTAYLPQNVQTLFLYDSVNKEVNSEALLSRYGLDAFRQRNPFDLSGGEAQRLALAKIEQTGADILLLDEPTKGTDPVFRAKLAGILKAWCAAGKTVILSTHDLEFAGRYADNVTFLFGGNIVCTERRRKFFAALDIYTTSLSALTNGRIVSIDDAEVSP